MSRRWAYVIMFTVVTIILWSVWEVYRAFTKKQEIGEYERYVVSIDPEIDTFLIEAITEKQKDVLVKGEEIGLSQGTQPEE